MTRLFPNPKWCPDHTPKGGLDELVFESRKSRMTTTPRIHLLLIISCLLGKCTVRHLYMCIINSENTYISVCLTGCLIYVFVCAYIKIVSVHSRLHKSHKQQDGSTEQVTSQSDPNSELESQPPDAVENEMPTVHQESRRDEQDDINHVSEGMAAAVSGKEGFNSEQELDGVSEVQDDSSMTDKKEDGLTPHNADHHQQQREEEQQEEQRGVEEKESNGMGGEGLEQTTVSEDKGGAVTTASGDDDQLDTAKDMESVGDQQEISEMRTGVDRSVVESDTATEEQDKSEVTGVGGEHEQDLEQTTDQTADQDVERTTLEGRHPELVIDGMSGEGSDSSGEEKEGNEEECVEDDRKTDEEPKEGTHYTRTPPVLLAILILGHRKLSQLRVS